MELEWNRGWTPLYDVIERSAAFYFRCKGADNLGKEKRTEKTKRNCCTKEK